VWTGSSMIVWGGSSPDGLSARGGRWSTDPSLDVDQDGFTSCSADCDDTRASVHPGALQICDGLNNDCSHPSWPALTGTNEADDDADTFSECQGDCDDTRASVYAGAPQVCDGLNNDCSDPAWPASLPADRDADADTHTTCGVPPDCNDASPAV